MLPVLIEIGPLKVHSWGVLLMLGFLLGTWRAARNAPRYGIKSEDAWDVALWGLLGGVIGARLVYVLLTPSLFANPLSILHIWEGGMTFYGGLGGGILAGMLLCRMRGINIADMADLAAVSFPIGYALGRVGCFLNGCCYGGACPPPLGMRFQDPGIAGGLTPYSHPAQLYSALAGLLMYVLLSRMERGRRFRGQLMLAFLFLYAIYRFFIEFVRAEVTAKVTEIAGLTQGQIASLLLALAVAAAYIIAQRRAGRPESDPSARATRPSVI